MSQIIEKLGGEEIGPPASVKKVALASWIGTTIEWYDFYLYGTAAALVFNKLFFPQFDPLVGTLAAFATFWVGFAARPIGGIVFGHFGDKIGRKSMLILTLLIMGIATFLIGLLPTYAVLGAWAAVLLVVLRFIEGFAVGGEWGGAVLMATDGRAGRAAALDVRVQSSDRALFQVAVSGYWLAHSLPAEYCANTRGLV